MTMKVVPRTRQRSLVAALAAILSACGGASVSGAGVTGVALTDAPISGSVSLTDSSTPAKERVVSTRPDGSFSVDVDGLAAPYLLKVEWSAGGATRRLYGVAEGSENLDITPISDVAFAFAAGDTGEEVLFKSTTSGLKRSATVQARAVLADLATAISPLLERYGISDLGTDKLAVRTLLQDVTVTRESGVVTLLNRSSGATIYSGRIRDPRSGSFNPGQMPPGRGGSSSGAASSSGSSGASSSGGASSGGASSGGSSSGATGRLPPNHPAIDAGASCTSCHGGGASGGGSSSGGSSGGGASGGTGQLPPNHPAVDSSASCASCHGSGGGASSGGMPPPPPGSSSGGASSSGASSGGSSSGGWPPPPPGSSSGGSSSGGASSGGSTLPPGHPAVDPSASCASCHR